MRSEDRVERARQSYERAVYRDGVEGIDEAERELDAVEADVALARGRLIHARFLAERDNGGRPMEDPRELPLFERAAKFYRALGDTRGEADAVFWIGTVHQVVRRDNETAVPILQRARELAVAADDPLILSEALRHLGIAEHGAGNLDAARALLEESTGLRRAVGLLPGVASNLIGLAYIAFAQDRRPDALALLDEADALASRSGADRILHHIREARAAVGA
ncbi:MAG TPA: hypothetical protein VF062_01295 [Candidatus Limnocylindrales bacterium]